ncbi:alcohol dehydrogenase, partial [bacterium]
MKAAVYYNNHDIRIEEYPVPEISDDELLVKVESCGICGSDVMEWYRIKKAPLVLGHEIAGTIFEVGRNVEKFAAGQEVFVSHHVPCNTCRYCLAGMHSLCDTLRTTNFDPGGFSQFIRVPRINVDRGTFVLPSSISFDEGTFV